jgi:hypothetical protein
MQAMKSKTVQVPTWMFWLAAFALLSLVVGFVAKATGGWPRLENFLQNYAPAWIQAVGSIAAILAASGIANKQASHARDIENEQRIRNEVQKLEVIKALMIRSMTMSREVIQALESRKLEDFSVVTPSMMRDAHQTLLLLPIFEIPNAMLSLDVLTVGRVLECLSETWEAYVAEVEKMEALDTPMVGPLHTLAGELSQISEAAFEDCLKELRQRRVLINDL